MAKGDERKPVVRAGAAATPLTLCAFVLLALAGVVGASAAPRPPKPVQLSYQEVRDGSAPRYRLMAFSQRTDSVRFTTRFEGEKASADSRYEGSITDTDLHGDARHPFVIRRDRSDRKVLKLIREALDQRGLARVRVHARGPGGAEVTKFVVVLAQCSQDPPFYPVDCEVSA